ncbi:carboxyvinyl-carboxyphosphonate phosphorylmutase [Actinocatenispora thailandica]|uniref:Carboxyvinyl-carboxyphosphonate phosphorylmutase n=1 Tax=Actinocatenispora thailandica TaxID=227318 RepID=A0A7R7DWQ6_9ACTN|nr:isocitrate lyase/phosphoenolpyruvate mutase family protein [Actinocatenispora thailandica]BCJ38777.1 carboxyvinyl-carboxyphosphonate phosphorylmutase [Actinocatenispora thailandica]
MTAPGLAAAAAAFRALHRPGNPVVLPNAWDAYSARIVAERGFPAVATSSIAVAESLGYRDGGGAPAELMFAAAGRIARAVDLPVTVDAEDGYGLPAADLVAALLAAGAVGANVEDSTGGVLSDVDTQAARLAGIRAAAVAAGVPLVLNARIDVFLRSTGADEAELVDAAIARAERYLAAGADCVYPIFCPPETVSRLVAGIDGAVNVHWRPDGPSPAELAELGVARISAGGALWRMAMDSYRNAVGRLVI